MVALPTITVVVQGACPPDECSIVREYPLADVTLEPGPTIPIGMTVEGELVWLRWQDEWVCLDEGDAELR